MPARKEVNTPSAPADGFSDKLRGIPQALRLKAGSRPRKVRPEQHDLRSGHIAVTDTAAVVAVMYSFSECLALDRAAFRARLACATRIDQLQRQPQEERARIPLSASADSPLRAIMMAKHSAKA